ncbi:MAG: tyrosine-type recombinase/integrase [Mycobacterium sp.]
MGLSRESCKGRGAAAATFLADHHDLAAWMRRPLPIRLADLKRCPLAWPLVGFVLLTGQARADFDLLAAKHAGRSFAPTAAAIYPRELAELHAAADRLGWAPSWTAGVLGGGLPLVIAATGTCPSLLSQADIDVVREAVRTSPYYTAAVRHSRLSQLHSLARLLYEAGVLPAPPVHRRGDGPGNLESRLAVVAAPEIRRVLLAYVRAKQAVLKAHSIRNLTSHLAAFGEFLTRDYPTLTSVSLLRREHIEAYCAFVPTRTWRGQRVSDKQIGSSSIIAGLIAVRGFLDDITAWGWAEAPTRRLMFASDIPRPPRQLPRALPPDVDTALMAAVAELSDLFARVGLVVMRGAGLRIGELLDLELDCVVDYGPNGHWLRVPLGKLNSERSVPLDEATLAALDQWRAQRGNQRALPDQRDGHMVDFLFTERGKRPGHARIERGLAEAVRAAGLTGPDAAPVHVTPHQLRHCYATALANAGMSIQGLMALLGHTTPEMTLRYATLASPTLHAAYETAMGRMRPRLPIAPVGKPIVPDRVQWLASEMLKTRVAHGYCARQLAAEACPYANICETCQNFLPAHEFLPALRAQIADIRELRDDAATRGWDSEVARHQRILDSLEKHLHRLEDPR